jgi:hypothetical protein
MRNILSDSDHLVGIIIVCSVFLAAVPVEGQQVFTEVSTAMGISGQTGLGDSVGWCDIDNDRDPDLATANQDGSGFWLYRNDGTTFTNITASAGLGGITVYRIIWAELNGDDYSDLIVYSGSSSSTIYLNDGNNHFTNGGVVAGGILAAADFNNDGSTDLLTTGSSITSILYNSGSGSFSPTVIDSDSYWCGVCLDYDLDGDLDVYLGTYGADPNVLLRNDGVSFTDVTGSAGVTWTGGTSGITTGDYNNDGYPDLYLGNTSAPGCKLFRNQGNGTFTDVTAAAGVTGFTDTRTPSFVDYNNDGHLDIYVSNHDFFVNSSQMYRNNANGTFTDVGEALGLSGEWMGDYFGLGWADYNVDGDIDLFTAGHIDKYNLFRNDQSETMPAGYINLELIGTVSNRNAIGARVALTCGSVTLTRWVTAGEGYNDFHDFPLEFGLYSAATVTSLQINWPSGIVETYSGIAADLFITAVEGDSLYIGIENPETSVTSPGDLALTCSPNPFHGFAVVHFSSSPGVETELSMFDLSGRRVRTLFSGVTDGSGSVSWDGRDRSGAYVPEGVYICLLRTSAGTASELVTLIRQ